MKYFTKDFVAFFKELEKNNNRDWFQENKKRYESSVKNPFSIFVEALIGRLSEIYPNLTQLPKEAIFRINRDVRFSADKTPYKVQSSALISEKGKKDYATPAFYIQANHNDVRVYSGSHRLDKNQLQNLRSEISHNMKEFNKLITDKKFTSTFGEILGDKNKRIPKEFVDAEKEQPLIANKSMYYFFKQPSSSLVKDALIDGLIEGYKAAIPLNQFIERAISVSEN